MTLDAAAYYAGQIVARETRGPGDAEDAMRRIEARYGIGSNQLLHLKSHRAKSCDISLFARLRGAYLDLCERQVRQLQHELEIEKATGHDFDADIAAEAEGLAAKIAAAKAARGR